MNSEIVSGRPFWFSVNNLLKILFSSFDFIVYHFLNSNIKFILHTRILKWTFELWKASLLLINSLIKLDRIIIFYSLRTGIGYASKTNVRIFVPSFLRPCFYWFQLFLANCGAGTRRLCHNSGFAQKGVHDWSIILILWPRFSSLNLNA